MIPDYERVAAAFVTLVIDALGANLACCGQCVGLGLVCVGAQWSVKNFHLMDSPPMLVVQPRGLNWG